MKCKVCGKMHGFTEDECRLRKTIEAAEDKFWAEVVHWYPQAKSSDLDPEVASDLSQRMASAIKRWVEFNVKK